jgi:hypothetical protein
VRVPFLAVALLQAPGMTVAAESLGLWEALLLARTELELLMVLVLELMPGGFELVVRLWLVRVSLKDLG